MAHSIQLSDPSDWIGTAIEPLGKVDAALRCQVCKEYFRTPMITACTHTFCSLCIRRCITADGKCPTCRTEVAISRLCKNTTVAEMVEAFEQARPVMLEVGRHSLNHATGSKRARVDGDTDVPPPKSKRQTRSEGRQEASRTTKDMDDLSSPEHSVSLSPAKDGYSRCPICTKEMRIEQVYSHLDIHNEPQQRAPTHALVTRDHSRQITQQPEQKPLPNINYSILRERDLRNRLAALGISSSGSKTALQRRHTEFLNIWNANCDSTRPRTKQQLVRDLEEWERSQGVPPQLDATMKKDFDGHCWSSEHQSDFQRLIAEARGKSSRSATGSSHNDEPSVAATEPLDIREVGAAAKSGDTP
jgi:E3 ubiquitin-protein ligase RAD18